MVSVLEELRNISGDRRHAAFDASKSVFHGVSFRVFDTVFTGGSSVCWGCLLAQHRRNQKMEKRLEVALEIFKLSRYGENSLGKDLGTAAKLLD